MHENECMRAAEISRRAGVFRDRGTVATMNIAITTEILKKLDEHGRVARCKQNVLADGN